MHVIYSHHPDDPASMSSLPWHGNKRRGTKSVMLLSSTLQSDAIGMPSDLITHDFLNKQVRSTEYLHIHLLILKVIFSIFHQGMTFFKLIKFVRVGKVTSFILIPHL